MLFCLILRYKFTHYAGIICFMLFCLILRYKFTHYAGIICFMLLETYYAQSNAGIICLSLSHVYMHMHSKGGYNVPES